MTTLQPRPFVFPDHCPDDSYETNDRYSSSSSNSSTNLEIKATPRITTTDTPKTSVDMNSISSPPVGKPPRAPAPQQPQSINSLVRSDIEYRASEFNATSSSEEVIQLVVYYNIINRLHGALQDFYLSLSDKSRIEPGKFASTYQQALDMVSSITSNDYSRKAQGFSTLLKPGYRALLTSFLTLIKSSPSFVASCLLSMPTADLNNLTMVSQDPYDDLVGLGRSRPLEIMFYSLFPAETPELQRAEYFSSICASLIDHRKGEKFCIDVLDKFMNHAGYPYAASLEVLLLSLLQSGSFLTQSHNRDNAGGGGSVASSPASEYYSPDLGNVGGGNGNGVMGMKNFSSSSLPSVYETGDNNQAREFVSDAIDQLLEFFDNPAMESIPNGFLVFVRLILSKVLDENRHHALYLIIGKFFFHKHLQRILTMPERLGVLKSTFINDIQRQRILSPVYHTLNKMVLAVFDQHGEDPTVRRHVESIMDLVTAAPPAPVFTKFDDAPESVEYYSKGQMVVASASDVVCLYSSLFPSYGSVKQPPTTTPKYMVASQFSNAGLRSPFPETCSTTAMSYVSSNSDPLDQNVTTEVDEEDEGNDTIDDDDDNDNEQVSISAGPAVDYEWSLEDIRKDIEPVIEDLVKRYPYLQFRNTSIHHRNFQTMRPNKLQNFRLPHPMTDKWQCFQVDDRGELQDMCPESILKQARTLQTVASEDDPFADRDEQQHLPSIASSNRGLVNVVRRAVERIVSDATLSPYPFSYYGAQSDLTGPGYLHSLLSDSLHKSLAKGFYLDGNEYSNALTALNRLLPSNLSSNYDQVAIAINNHVIDSISREKERNRVKVEQQVAECQSYASPYKIHLCNAKSCCDMVLDKIHDLRVKVWYVTEIRPGTLWNRAKDVARALSCGAPASSSIQPESFGSLKRNHSSSSLASTSMFSLKRFTSTKREYPAHRRQTMMSNITPNLQPEGMYAAREIGGEHKLSDRESVATNKWLNGQSIQNFCRGEERIHRFCCEVDDLVKRIMGDTLSSRRNKGHSLLSSSSLFKHDLWKMITDVEGVDRASTSSLRASSTILYEEEQPSLSRSGSSRSSHRHQRSSPSLLDIFANMDLGAARRGSHSDQSPHDSGYEPSGSPRDFNNNNHHRQPRRNKSMDEAAFHLDPSLVNNAAGQAVVDSPEVAAKRKHLDDFVFDLQMRLTGMIYTDIGMSCWSEGCETDKWMNAPIIREAIDRDLEQKEKMRQHIARNAAMQVSMFKLNEPPASSARNSRASVGSQPPPPINFHPESSETLSKLDTQSRESVAAAAAAANATTTNNSYHSNHTNTFKYDDAYKSILHRLSVTPSPMGKLNTLYALEMLVVSSLSTSLASTPSASIRNFPRSAINSETPTPMLSPNFRMKKPATAGAVAASASSAHSNQFFNTKATPNTDAIAEELRRIFKTVRSSKTLFRDLQFIAAFVPPSVLDLTDVGKAFWDVCLAAMSMKEETLGIIVDTSSEIFQYCTGMMNADKDHYFLSQWTLSDVAWLWSVAAKEGETIGQRELAIMHLSHPHLTPISLAPFAKLSEVFGTGFTLDQHDSSDVDKLDPVRMAVIKHWMTQASTRGDNIATEYLMQEQGRI